AAGAALAVAPVRRAVGRRLGTADEEYLARLGRGGGGSDVWRSFSTEQRALVREGDAVGDVIARVSTPAPVLGGGRDRIVRPSAARRLAERLVRGRLVSIPNAGHLLPVVAPAIVTRAVLDALG